MMDILATPPTNSGARLLYLPLDLIDIPEGGVRRAAVEESDDAGFRLSIAQLGVIQPIAVRAHPEDPDRRVLITGRRRLAAARAAGIAAIAVADHGAIPEREAIAIETAENLQRVGLAPLDQWRAMRRHIELGWTLEDAAQALGIGYALARKLDKLGSLHPDVLAAIEAHGISRGGALHTIASAPPEAQARVLKKHWKNPAHAVPWWEIARDLVEVNIPRARAIFDAEASGLVWIEDVFAEPGSPGQWTTTDLPGFLAAQKAELARQAEASKGKIVVVEAGRDGQPKLPPKWTDAWGWCFGEKLPKGCTGYVMLRPTGELVTRAAKPPAKAKAPPSPAPAADAAGERERDGVRVDDDTQEPDGEEDAPAPAPKPRWTEKGRIEIAARKTLGLQTALRDHATPSAPEALRLLLMTLAARNLTVAGEGGRRVDFEDIAAVAHQADAEDEPILSRLAMEAMARTLRCAPVKPTYGNVASGAAAEWVGAAIEADLALDRFDDAELLTTASAEALRAMAEAEGIPVKPTATAKALREAITGKLANTIPTEAEFRADPPAWVAPEAADEDAICGQREQAETCKACDWRRADGEDAEPCGRGLWRAALSRLGLHPDDVEVGPEGQVTLRPHALARRATPTPPSPEAKPAPAAFACAWPGHAVCTEEGTHRCMTLCPRHDKFVAWLTTTEGKAARRAADNAAAKASLKKPRAKKQQQEGTPG